MARHPYRRRVAEVVFLVAMAWLAGSSGNGQVAVRPAAADLGTRAVQSESVLGRHLEADEPGCSAAVGIDGVVVWASARGIADLATGAKLNTSTVFDIGSVSKQFTAAAVLLLADEGRLSVEDTVADHLAGQPDWVGRITINQLIHHTSGLRDYFGLLANRGHVHQQRTTQAQAMQAVAEFPYLDFEPGTQYGYSNSNYLFLAEIVHTVSGTPLPQFLQQRIFGPLDLDMVMAPNAKINGKAVPYIHDAGGFQVTDSRWDQIGPGGVQTTPTELVRWADNYRTGQVGGVRLLDAQLAEPRVDNSAPAYSYGAGIGVGRDGSLAHSGGWGGFTTDFLILPDRRTAIALACNSALPGRGRIETITTPLAAVWR